MSHESCDAEYESHRVRVGGRTRYKKGALAAQELARTFSPTPPAIEISTPWEIIVGWSLSPFLMAMVA